MSHQLDPKEAYLYGVLLELTKKQVSAMQKALSGNLGMWGKSRFNSRTKEIEKIIFHIFKKKECPSEQMVTEILSDFDYIGADTGIWADTTPEEIDYLRKIVTQLA